MTRKQYLFALLAMLILCVGFGVVGCEEDPEDEVGSGGFPEGDIDAVNLDCSDTNWVRDEGQNGRLYQELEITINVPEGYDGPIPPYMVGTAFAVNPDVPVMDMPPLMGESDQSAELVPGEPYTTISTYQNRCSVCEGLPCGNYFYMAVQIYQTELSFPVAGEWIYMSEETYQVGGDRIVIEVPVDMVPNRM